MRVSQKMNRNKLSDRDSEKDPARAGYINKKELRQRRGTGSQDTEPESTYSRRVDNNPVYINMYRQFPSRRALGTKLVHFVP